MTIKDLDTTDTDFDKLLHIVVACPVLTNEYKDPNSCAGTCTAGFFEAECTIRHP